jgi:hypothetical protein
MLELKLEFSLTHEKAVIDYVAFVGDCDPSLGAGYHS